MTYRAVSTVRAALFTTVAGAVIGNALFVLSVVFVPAGWWGGCG